MSHRISIRTARFLGRFGSSENGLCGVFHDQAQRHMSELLAKLGIEVLSWYMLSEVTVATDAVLLGC